MNKKGFFPKFSFGRWLHFHTSDYYLSTLWLDTKFKIANYFDAPPAMEKGEDFRQYLERAPQKQALRISRHFYQKHQALCKLMNRVDLRQVPGRVQNKMYKQRLETVEWAGILEEIY